VQAISAFSLIGKEYFPGEDIFDLPKQIGALSL
jgi:hypothetical protein